MSQTLNLFRLQTLDSQIDKIHHRVIDINKILNDDSRLKQAQKKLDQAKAKSKTLRIELKQIEDKVEAQTLKRKTTQAALFGGKVKNPKELQDLQRESEALKRYIGQLEDEQLETMIAHESADSTERKAEKYLDQIMGEISEENASMLGEKNKLEEELSRLLMEREAVLQSIPDKSLALYENLRKNKHGIAVAAVSDGGCSICGQSLTPADLQSIRASNKIVFCPNCGRILFAS